MHHRLAAAIDRAHAERVEKMAPQDAQRMQQVLLRLKRLRLAGHKKGLMAPKGPGVKKMPYVTTKS